MAKEIGSLHRYIKQGFLAGSTVMGNTGHHQMPQVIGFKVQAVSKRTFLILGSYLGTNHGMIVFLM
ncbi:hypothetical protein SDC9_105919 [bioreactor metagenome]|uniref:Uncharacterized protein n=1 Tax=bioreactor metagenome TaxID=1076179 RepID=A0A645B3E4_9ZZZZ